MPAVRGGATLTAGAKAAPMSGAASTARASEASRVGRGRASESAKQTSGAGSRAARSPWIIACSSPVRPGRIGPAKTMRARPGARASRSRRTG